MNKPVTTIFVIIAVFCHITSAHGSQPPKSEILVLRGGAEIEGTIQALTADSVTLATKRGELVIPIKNLEENSRLGLQKRVDEIRKNQEQLIKDNRPPRFVSELLEKKELEAQESEGSRIRIKFGRKDFVYRRYTHRNKNIDYIFTPVGQTQIYDSEDSLRLTFNDDIKNISAAKQEVDGLLNSLGEGITILPPAMGISGQRRGGISFSGTVDGTDGNPPKAIYGKIFEQNGRFRTLIYTHLGRQKSFDETKAWLGRNFERLQVVMGNLNTLPEKKQLEELSEVDINKETKNQ